VVPQKGERWIIGDNFGCRQIAFISLERIVVSDSCEGTSVKPVPESYWLGQELDWDAEWTPVILWVELPFWLMVSDCTIQVEVQGHPFTVDVCSGFVELFVDEVADSRRTAVYIGPDSRQLNAEVRKEIEEDQVPALERKCKTVLRIHSRCNQDVLNAVEEGERRADIALLYLKALCEAHFEVINHVVRGYRLATYDYFPYELSPWDIPIWRIATPAGFVPVVLFPYAGWDRKPMK
jgi:hypothetical protein